MPISFSCQKCGKRLKAPDAAAGKTSKCPGCGAPVTCPEPIYEAEVVEPPKPDMPEILDDEFDPYGLDDGEPYAVETPPDPDEGKDRRPCPMCGEMIVVDAAKCRFCGEVFDENLKQAIVKKKKAKKKKRSYDPDEEDMSSGDWIVAILCSGIGCIAGIVWMIQGKPKGVKMLIASVIANFVWVAIRLAIMSQQGGIPGQ